MYVFSDSRQSFLMFWRQKRKTATRKLVSVSRPFTSPFSYPARKVSIVDLEQVNVFWVTVKQTHVLSLKGATKLYILRIMRAWSLFCSIGVYASLHFYRFFWERSYFVFLRCAELKGTQMQI